MAGAFICVSYALRSAGVPICVLGAFVLDWICATRCVRGRKSCYAEFVRGRGKRRTKTRREWGKNNLGVQDGRLDFVLSICHGCVVPMSQRIHEQKLFNHYNGIQVGVHITMAWRDFVVTCKTSVRLGHALNVCIYRHVFCVAFLQQCPGSIHIERSSEFNRTRQWTSTRFRDIAFGRVDHVMMNLRRSL